MTLNPGRKLGSYEILAPLGAGGMGEVYRALDPRVGREVALKILPPEIAGDRGHRSRFEREAVITASLSHPNIVQLLDVGLDHDPPYLVSELVRGETLRSHLRAGTLPLRKALDIAAQVASGLASAHAAGIVHRDIKPDNLMLTPDGRVKILDFGLGRIRDDLLPASADSETRIVDGRRTDPGLVVGTVDYMSPEQARGKTVDYRSDQFSLGLVLYEALAGRQAFRRDSAVQTMTAIIEEDPPPLPCPVPTQVRWVTARCMAKDPLERYDSTADLARELRALHDHLSELTPQVGESALRPSARGRRRLAASVATAAAIGMGAWIAGRLSVPPERVDLSRYGLAPFGTALRSQTEPAWSPTGRSIAFYGSTEDGTTEIWLQGVDGGAPVQLTPASFIPSRWTTRLSWSPDERAVYATGFFEEQQGLYRVPSSGSKPELVRDSVGPYALSPDCKTIVTLAQSELDGGWELWWASPIAGSKQRYQPSPFKLKTIVDRPLLAFAPDGARLFVTYNTGSRTERWILPWPPGRGQRILEQQWEHFLDFASWMPDSRHLVYAEGLGAQRQDVLGVADLDKQVLWPIYTLAERVRGVSVSPDGRRIAFGSDRSHYDVIEVPLDGSPPRTIVGTSRNEEMPMLSGDGKELVYVSDRRGPAELIIRDMTTGSERTLLRLEDLPAGRGAPIWFMTPTLSPDHQRVAFSSRVGTSDRIYVALTKGGAPTLATSEDSVIEFAPAWSPDGSLLAIQRSTGGPSTLSVVRPGSANPPHDIVLSVRGMSQWSPGGDWIACNGDSGLMIVRPDGSERRRLAGGGGVVAWSPDGETLYVIRSETRVGRLYEIDIRSGDERASRALDELIPAASLEPGRRVSVTPDGRSLVYAVQRSQCEIWILAGVQLPKPWFARLWPRR